jgi:hypothetical protein
MEIGFHPPGEADQETEQGDVNQNHAHASLVVRFHQRLVRIACAIWRQISSPRFYFTPNVQKQSEIGRLRWE